jgi:Bifunctional DNA primase/polymerase, N-terminal
MTPDPGDQAALARALAYARHGWPVFPCKPGRKEPDTPHGFKDATTYPARITTWWTAVPGRNVAIATGAPGPDVLDVDVRSDGSGYPAFRRLKRAGLLDGCLALVATPSGGLHAYYTGTTQPSGRLPGRHLDFKAVGGYVLAPPSAVGGKPYRLIEHHQQDRQPEGGQLDWAAATALLDPPRLRPQPAREPEHSSDAARLAAWVEGLAQGNRNAGLFWAACRAAESSDPSALDVLARAARTAGLPEQEIRRTITSARRRSAGHRQPDRARRQPCTTPEPDHESEAVI